MGDGNRTSGFYLLAEQWNNGTVASQYIPESGGNEGGVSDDSSFLDGGTQTLGIHFGQSLGGSHDIARSYGLVGRDHDELVYIVADSCFGNNLCAADVGMYRFARMFFHEWHMLVGSRMENDMWAIALNL